jgi:hypothetical protein
MYAIWMMFDALVRTVEAMEATVWVDALDLASLGVAAMSPGFSIG